MRPVCLVTNRSDPPGGSGLDRIRWQRGTCGTIEQAQDVVRNALAGAALPNQTFAANAAWLRLNLLLDTLLTAFQRVGLPQDFHTARPKRRRVLVRNTIATVVRPARDTLLRCSKARARTLAERPRTAFALTRPA